jgi:ABC-2 type transport system permease protein
MEEAIDDGRVLAALVIPEDFAGRVRSDRSSTVQLLLDASDANTATIALGYADAVVSGYSADLEVRWAKAKGLQEVRPPLAVHSRVWFNTDLESRNFIIPGLISVIMMIIAALLTSLTVAREWEQGTMEQLIATPVTATELILGKLLPYFVIGMLDLAVAVAMGKYLFHVPMRGSLPLLFGIAAVFLVGALSVGMLLSVATRSQLPASQMAMAFTFLPSYLLSGFVFSIDSMPRVVRAVTYLVPSRYFVKVIKGIYLKGVGLGTLAVDTAMLLVFGAAMVLAATRMFRKKLR